MWEEGEGARRELVQEYWRRGKYLYERERLCRDRRERERERVSEWERVSESEWEWEWERERERETTHTTTTTTTSTTACTWRASPYHANTPGGGEGGGGIFFYSEDFGWIEGEDKGERRITVSSYGQNRQYIAELRPRQDIYIFLRNLYPVSEVHKFNFTPRLF